MWSEMNAMHFAEIWISDKGKQNNTPVVSQAAILFQLQILECNRVFFRAIQFWTSCVDYNR